MLDVSVICESKLTRKGKNWPEMAFPKILHGFLNKIFKTLKHYNNRHIVRNNKSNICNSKETSSEHPHHRWVVFLKPTHQ